MCIGFKFYTQVYNHKMCQVGFRVKSTNYFWSYGPFSTLKNSFRSTTSKRLVNWIHILYNKHIIVKYVKFDLG